MAVSKQLRELVAGRAGWRCEYCRWPEHYGEYRWLEVEHIFPKSRGGERADPENLAYSCRGCNGAKSNDMEADDPDTGLVVLLFHPRKQKWRDHFTWSEDLLKVIGLTATGRATVVKLALNRPNAQAIRRVMLLANEGEHPPED